MTQEKNPLLDMDLFDQINQAMRGVNIEHNDFEVPLKRNECVLDITVPDSMKKLALAIDAIKGRKKPRTSGFLRILKEDPSREELEALGNEILAATEDPLDHLLLDLALKIAVLSLVQREPYYVERVDINQVRLVKVDETWAIAAPDPRNRSQMETVKFRTVFDLIRMFEGNTVRDMDDSRSDEATIEGWGRNARDLD